MSSLKSTKLTSIRSKYFLDRMKTPKVHKLINKKTQKLVGNVKDYITIVLKRIPTIK